MPRTYNRLQSWLRPGLIVPVVLFFLAVAALANAYTFGRSSGMFPRFIGWIFVGLTLLEMMLQLKRTLLKGEEYRFDWSLVKKQLAGVGWLTLLLAMVFVLGFLVAVPVFVLAFLRLAAGQSYRRSLSLAAGALAFVYGIFVWLLEYDLYNGIVVQLLT